MCNRTKFEKIIWYILQNKISDIFEILATEKNMINILKQDTSKPVNNWKPKL